MNKTKDIKEVNNQSIPWVEKYRPQTLSDLISHDDIISTCIQETFFFKKN